MSDPAAILLTESELRAVTHYAVACARPTIETFERERPGDCRPRLALQEAQAFADGARRTKALRDAAWAAQRAAQEASAAGCPAASEAARAALAAAGAAFLHPLAKATQTKHIVGAAAHAARALELVTPQDPAALANYLDRVRSLATVQVVDVLRRYPGAPPGGGRVGALRRWLDAALR